MSTESAQTETPVIGQARLDWVREQLARCSYKNWTTKVDLEGFAQPVVILQFSTDDSTNPGAPFTAESAYNISDLPTDAEAFKLWWLAAVVSAEMHEAAERVMFDGKLVVNPHSPEDRPYSLGLYDRICDVARANGDPYRNVLHAATVHAVLRGTVPSEVPAQTGCTDHLQRNIPRRLAEPPRLPQFVTVS